MLSERSTTEMRREQPAEAMHGDEPHESAAHLPEHVAAPIGSDRAAEVLKDGPIGALVIASIAVALLFLGWMAFYFLLFVTRGPIG